MPASRAVCRKKLEVLAKRRVGGHQCQTAPVMISLTTRCSAADGCRAAQNLYLDHARNYRQISIISVLGLASRSATIDDEFAERREQRSILRRAAITNDQKSAAAN